MKILRRTRRGPIEDSSLGASAAEYALIVSLIAVVIIVAVALFGGAVGSLFDKGATCVKSSSAC